VCAPCCKQTSADWKLDKAELKAQGFDPDACTFIEDHLAPKPDPALSLLIIDLGDSCVVKVESETWNYPMGMPKYYQVNGVILIPWTLSELRVALTDKPLPRIERKNEYGLAVYYREAVGPGNNYENLGTKAYDALTELNNGKPLPIWTPGKWTRLEGEVVAWRYEN
jgi:hypothetical protein